MTWSSAQVRATLHRATPPLLILLSAAVILVGKADQGMFDSFRVVLTDDAAPVLDILSRPVGMVTTAADRVRGFIATYSDNARLEEENARLLQWQQTALNLSAENQKLRQLLKAVPDNAVSYVTARVIASSGGSYVRTMMVNAGTGAGVARGQTALTGEGLVGRLTEVGNRAARILLITDLNSRIPVRDERSHVNAVLAGDNSERPRLLYASDPSALKVGDRIVTSGEGGIFPPGLPVGVVSTVEPEGIRIEPFADLSQLSYVIIADYGLAGALPQPVPVATTRGRRNRPASADEASMQ